MFSASKKHKPNTEPDVVSEALELCEIQNIKGFNFKKISFASYRSFKTGKLITPYYLEVSCQDPTSKYED